MYIRFTISIEKNGKILSVYGITSEHESFEKKLLDLFNTQDAIESMGNQMKNSIKEFDTYDEMLSNHSQDRNYLWDGNKWLLNNRILTRR
jgi:hypothetical protein